MTVFIDTAVVMYAAGADHELKEPSSGSSPELRMAALDAVVSVEVVQEIIHRFMALRRPDRALRSPGTPWTCSLRCCRSPTPSCGGCPSSSRRTRASQRATSFMSRPACRRGSATSSARTAASTSSRASAGSTQPSQPTVEARSRAFLPWSTIPMTVGPSSTGACGRCLSRDRSIHPASDRRCACARHRSRRFDGRLCRRDRATDGACPSDTYAGPALDPASLGHVRDL